MLFWISFIAAPWELRTLLHENLGCSMCLTAIKVVAVVEVVVLVVVEVIVVVVVSV